MTKKAAALLLAASLAVSVCATPVFATVDRGSKDGVAGGTTTDVFYKVKDEFTWSVPATIDFGESAGPKEQKRTVTATLDEDTDGEAAATNSDGSSKNGTAPRVYVTKNVINPANKLYISLSAGAAGSFEVVHTTMNTVKLGYEVKAKNAKVGSGTADTTEKEVETTGTEILVVPAGTNTGEVELVFTLTTTSESAEKSGDYKGTVTFTATSKAGT